jgi:anti-sigma factor RsiW
MMDCLTHETLLQYVEAEISAAEAEEIRRHMEQCSHCRQEIDAIQTLVLNLGKLAWPEDPAPDANAGCVEAMTLAAYMDQQLTGAERERVEQHLVHCQACLDEFIAAGQRLESLAATPQPVPARLIEQATALEHSGAPTVAPLLPPLLHQLREWAAGLVPSPQWGFAVSGVAAAAILALYFVLFPSHESTGPLVQTDPGQQRFGYGYGTSAEVLAHGSVRLSQELRNALLVYDAQPTSTTRDTLLALLDQSALQVPAEQVSTIEIKRSLRATLASAPEAGQIVQVTLLKGGLLVIAEAP